MAAKGMSMTLNIIVAAVVILVTALVLLTIFGSGITPIGSLTEIRTQCSLGNKQLCQSTGSVSPTWSLKTYKVGEEIWSCEDACGTATPCNIDRDWVATSCP